MSTLGLGAHLESLGMQVVGMHWILGTGHWEEGMQDLESLGSEYASSGYALGRRYARS